MNKVHIFKYSVRLSIRKMYSLRAIGAYVIVLFYSSLLESPVKEYLAAMGAKISPWLFSHFLSNGSYQLVIALTGIYFFSDTPFLIKNETYQMNRCGRGSWLTAHILSLFETAVLYAVVCYLLSTLVLLPYLEWNAKWGAAIKTLSLTNAAGVYGSPIVFSYSLVGQTAPVVITLIAIAITALLLAFLGSVMLTLGLAFNRLCAAAIATAIPMWSVLVYNMGYYVRQSMSYVAPTLWMDVADIGNKTYGMYILPPYWFIFLALLGGIAALSAVSMFLMKRKNCNLENED